MNPFVLSRSTSTWTSTSRAGSVAQPFGCYPQENGDLRVIVIFKLIFISELGQQPLPRVDAIFDQLRLIGEDVFAVQF